MPRVKTRISRASASHNPSAPTRPPPQTNVKTSSLRSHELARTATGLAAPGGGLSGSPNRPVQFFQRALSPPTPTGPAGAAIRFFPAGAGFTQSGRLAAGIQRNEA